MKPISFALPFLLALTGAHCVPSGRRGPTVQLPVDSSTPDRPGEVAGGSDAVASAGGEERASPGPTAVDPLPPTTTVAPSRRPTGPYRVRLVDANMHDRKIFVRDGRTYVLGAAGERYALVISNPTAERVEAVVSVDGIDAIDGTPADFVTKRGYILPAFGSATIEGFRTSLDEVATFRFSSLVDSYAARLGHARDVGVIGVAFFRELAPVAVEAAPAPALSRGRVSADRGAEDCVGAAAPSSGASLEPSRAASVERRGLGTEFGESRQSHVSETTFVRERPTVPSELVSVRYNDRPGLLALGFRVAPPSELDGDLRLRETADPFRNNRFAAPPP